MEKKKKFQQRSNNSFLDASPDTQTGVCVSCTVKTRMKKKQKTIFKQNRISSYVEIHCIDTALLVTQTFPFLPLCEWVLARHCWRLLWSQWRGERGKARAISALWKQACWDGRWGIRGEKRELKKKLFSIRKMEINKEKGIDWKRRKSWIKPNYSCYCLFHILEKATVKSI